MPLLNTIMALDNTKIPPAALTMFPPFPINLDVSTIINKDRANALTAFNIASHDIEPSILNAAPMITIEKPMEIKLGISKAIFSMSFVLSFFIVSNKAAITRTIPVKPISPLTICPNSILPTSLKAIASRNIDLPNIVRTGIIATIRSICLVVSFLNRSVNNIMEPTIPTKPRIPAATPSKPRLPSILKEKAKEIINVLSAVPSFVRTGTIATSFWICLADSLLNRSVSNMMAPTMPLNPSTPAADFSRPRFPIILNANANNTIDLPRDVSTGIIATIRLTFLFDNFLNCSVSNKITPAIVPIPNTPAAASSKPSFASILKAIAIRNIAPANFRIWSSTLATSEICPRSKTAIVPNRLTNKSAITANVWYSLSESINDNATKQIVNKPIAFAIFINTSALSFVCKAPNVFTSASSKSPKKLKLIFRPFWAMDWKNVLR